MAKRANAETTETEETTHGQELDELYKAHQVHTLAQILFCQLTGTSPGGPGWIAPPIRNAGWSASSAHPLGVMHSAGPVNAYWYS